MKIRRDVFALFLFAKRIARGCRVSVVAREAGVSGAVVARAEERRPITPRQFERLCAWQGENPQIFFG